ncbi:unnamed protein product [Prorocentrum cordatum]|uniref:Mediator of RNA polymerase II transcription subunit 21 n=1 Tax=Prorocentrum cordatum TaxID=2364126 RepID=A0ABN9RA28_9DINO|nr:unnamed protein product [Polarella glacialis]
MVLATLSAQQERLWKLDALLCQLQGGSHPPIAYMSRSEAVKVAALPGDERQPDYDDSPWLRSPGDVAAVLARVAARIDALDQLLAPAEVSDAQGALAQEVAELRAEGAALKAALLLLGRHLAAVP